MSRPESLSDKKLTTIERDIMTTKIEDKNIVVQFSGWCEIDPAITKFSYIGSKPDKYPHTINGLQWLESSEKLRSEYILLSVIDIQQDCMDGSYDMIDLEIVEKLNV